MRPYLVLLAAGDSQRFGENKLLYELDGKPMYRHIAEELETLPGDFFAGKIVVTQYPVIGEALKKLGYRTVENRHSRLGISYSIRLALAQLAGETGSCCFAVCDQPWLRGETVMRLIRGWEESGKGMGALAYRGEPGNPVIFSSPYWPELMALSGDVGGKRVLRRHMEDVFLLEADSKKQLEDMDVK